MVFVPFAEGHDAWAREFGTRYALPVEVAPVRALPATALDAARGQLVAEHLVEAIDGLRTPGVQPIAVGLLERDMFIAERTDWAWAFAWYSERTAVISTARMAPSFWGEKPDTELQRARLHKMVARILGGLLCGLPRTGGERSVMRPMILSVDDLDQIDESDWSIGIAPEEASHQRPGEVTPP